MINLAKIIAFTMCLMTLSAGLYTVQASDNMDNAASIAQRTPYTLEQRHGGFQDGVPTDLMRSSFIEACKQGADPRVVERVCKAWYNLMRYQIPSAGAPKADPTGFLYETKLNDVFMEDCIKLYTEAILSQGVLYFRKGDPQKERSLRFSDFQNGSAKLDVHALECFDPVYTYNQERLSMIRGANERLQVVIFFGAFHKAFHLLPADTKGSVLDIVVIWRSNIEVLRDDSGRIFFDYLIIRPSDFSGEYISDNWFKTARKVTAVGVILPVLAYMSCWFMGPN
jgi:hypothetical protein